MCPPSATERGKLFSSLGGSEGIGQLGTPPYLWQVSGRREKGREEDRDPYRQPPWALEVGGGCCWRRRGDVELVKIEREDLI